MSPNLSLATCGIPHTTGFVLVNDRVPRNDEHCALCGGTIEKAQQIAAHESPKTTKLYDRTSDQITLDEIERIVI